LAPESTDEETTTVSAGDLETTLEWAHRLGDEGDFQGMAEHLRASLEVFPGNPTVLCWLGVAERELGLDGVAYERFRACLEAGPEDPHILATAGNGVAAFDDPAAEPALRTAAMLAPGLALTRWFYGAYLAREGFLDRALDELREARSLEPENAAIAYELGVALALDGDHGGAVDEFFQATELETDYGWARVVLGLALIESGRVEEAAVELVAGARLRPDDPEAQLVASLAAAERGWDDVAWEMLERGRMGGEGTDILLADEVEERLERGSDEARAFLTGDLAPAA
jgi:tetratricopeptide (TPR) repeat protein